MNTVAGHSRWSGHGVDQRRIARIDWPLILATAILITVGLMSIYSEGITHDGDANFRKQVVDTIIGMAPFSIFALTPPRIWRRGVNVVYVFNLLVLASVFVIGSHRNGAERWIQLGPIQFQPSEMAKVATVLTLSAFYANRQHSIHKLSTFGLGFLHVLVPATLVLMQPHLGAALVLIVIWFGVSLVAGVPGRFLGATAGVVFVVVGSAVLFPKVPGKVLSPYQMKRVSGLLGGSSDPKGKGWQTNQAEIAFGVGGVLGSGYGKGERKAAHFIPEQHDDFIITVIGEEGGLIGCTLLLAAFGFFFYRLWLIMFQATEPYYKMIIGGLFAALCFHMFVNIAMVLGMVPVVGLWLPFISYGGTAMWMCMSAVGLALNIKRRERPLLF